MEFIFQRLPPRAVWPDAQRIHFLLNRCQVCLYGRVSKVFSNFPGWRCSFGERGREEKKLRSIQTICKSVTQLQIESISLGINWNLHKHSLNICSGRENNAKKVVEAKENIYKEENPLFIDKHFPKLFLQKR
jgi:hypothetical protein